jgi:hypothetical protein
MSDDPAGWQPDPTGEHEHRYWDGQQWTDHVADAGVASTDPYAPVADRDETTPDAVSPDAPTVVTPVPGGDTAVYPTAAPPPYVPPTPLATGGDGPRGGSRRGLVIGGAVLAAVVVAVIAFLALGGDDDEPTEQVSDEITTTTVDESVDEDDDEGETPETVDPEDLDDFEDLEDLDEIYEDAYESLGLTEEQVECLTDRIVDGIESGELDPEQAMAEYFSYLAECGISMEDLNGN